MLVFKKNRHIYWIISIYLIYFVPIRNVGAENNCNITQEVFDKLLNDIEKTNGKSAESLNSCLKSDEALMLQSAVRSSSSLFYASKELLANEDFILRLLKVKPDILQYATNALRSDEAFMTKTIYIERGSLKYGMATLLDNKLFMQKMIDLDARNYIYASYRLRKMTDVSSKALQGNGLLMEYAADEIKSNKEMAIIAIKSDPDAFDYLSSKLKIELLHDKKLKDIFGKKPITLDEDRLTKYILDNYLESDGNSLKVDHKALFFAKNKLIDRQYVVKWHRILSLENYKLTRTYQVIAADSRNYPNSWKDDLKEYPGLVKTIERFLQKRQIDKNTVDSLSLNYKWLISTKPETVAFKLYLLRDSKDLGLGSEFNDVTSLTAIAYKNKQKWDLSVVEVLFGKEIKMDIAYQHGHKQYELWDLYQESPSDRNIKLIYKVEDRFKEYFEVYGKDANSNKYRLIFRFDNF